MAILTNEDRAFTRPEDICAHVGDDYEHFCGAITPPIYQTSLFVEKYDSDGCSYTRWSNPTIEVAEKKIAALEHADGALCFSSGMAAISAAVMHCLKRDCHVVAVSSLYYNANRLFREYLPRICNLKCTFVSGESASQIIEAVRDDTALIYLESPSSAVFRMQDIEQVTRFAKQNHIRTIMDNSYATPINQNPIGHGVDIVCHSVSKYMSGHSDIVGGAVVSNESVIRDMQANERCVLGGNMDPHQAWLLARGLRTMPLRMKLHESNGMKMANFLQSHPKIERVFYPGGAAYPQKELFKKYMRGCNGLMSFVPTGDTEQIERFLGALRVLQKGVSWGGYESLIYSLSVGIDEREAIERDIPRNLIRLSVGLENIDTLIDDMSEALELI